MSGEAVRLHQDICEIQDDLLNQSNNIPSYYEINQALGQQFETLTKNVRECLDTITALQAENADDLAKMEEYESRLTMLKQPLKDEEALRLLYESQLKSENEKKQEIVENFNAQMDALSSSCRKLPTKYDNQCLENELSCLRETSNSISLQINKLRDEIEPRMKVFHENLPTESVNKDTLKEIMKRGTETQKELIKCQALEKNIINRNDQIRREIEELCKKYNICDDELLAE